MNGKEFWDWVEATKQDAEENMPKEFSWLSEVSETGMQQAAIQFHSFIWFYTYDLAKIIGKLPHSPLRTLVAEILSEELGDGDFSRSHLHLWEKFVYSLGVDHNKDIKSLVHKDVFNIVNAQSDRIGEVSLHQALGLRGIIGECVCETYLKSLHINLVKNPLWAEKGEEINTLFWHIHLDGGDEEHNQMVIDGVSDYAKDDPVILQEIADGYIEAMEIWKIYWGVIKNTVLEHEKTLEAA